MTPERLRECLDLLGWSQQELARQLTMDERQVRRWASGAAIPEAVAAWMQKLAAYHEKHPPPEKTDRRRRD